MQAYIDLIQEDEQQEMGEMYIPPSQQNPAGSKSLPGENVAPRNPKLVQQQREIEQSIQRQKQPQAPGLPPTKRSREPSPPPLAPDRSPDTWTCEICTLVNPINFLTCDACTVERPAHISASIPSSRSPPTSSSNSHSRSAPRGPRNTDYDRPAAFAPKHNAYDNLKRFEAQTLSKRDQSPMGWVCRSCGTFMESQWWVCDTCGAMKESS
jgi:DNA-dependent metalloprotease WSS1